MKLIAFLNSAINNLINTEEDFTAGYANGYVAVPKDHPFFGKDYNDVEVDVHGGLTFACPGNNITAAGLPEAEVLEGCLCDLDENWWVFGFDTCHHMDNLDNWPKEAVIAETLSLKKQLEEAYEQGE